MAQTHGSLNHGARSLSQARGVTARRFAIVHCSQCGEDFGPRDAGYSHCGDHEADALMAAESPDCAMCGGTGEGQYGDTRCMVCGGKGYLELSS